MHLRLQERLAVQVRDSFLKKAGGNKINRQTCQMCSKEKNVCQVCILDLNFDQFMLMLMFMYVAMYFNAMRLQDCRCKCEETHSWRRQASNCQACQMCSKAKNVCQVCILDLNFGQFMLMMIFMHVGISMYEKIFLIKTRIPTYFLWFKNIHVHNWMNDACFPYV